MRSITLTELQELAGKLGWTMKIEEKAEKSSLGTTKEAIIATLARHGITNGDELQEKRPVWFQKTFGAKELGAFLERAFQNITLTELQELAGKLGWTMNKK